MIQLTRYSLPAHLAKPLRMAVVADLHGEDHTKLLSLLQAEHPDLILIPGDLMEDHQLADPTFPCYRFLRECAALAPTYYSLGNHEIGCYHSENPFRHPTPTPLSKEIRECIAATGAVLLDDAFVQNGELCICGVTSGIKGKVSEPNRALLEKFSKQQGFRLLLCHHPEYYVPYIKDKTIDLTVCGHAHGGQWRVFGRGVYAPGQGIFPKYTSGVVDSRCVISRGLGNHTHIPRFFNRRELVIIDCGFSST